MFRKAFLVIGLLAVVGVGVYLWYWYWHTNPPCDTSKYTQPERDALLLGSDPIDPPAAAVKYLNQGWSAGDSMSFYTRTQGSRLLPYAWFLALEQADNDRLFRDPVNIARFRYLTQKPNDCNPDGLPVGFVKDPMRAGGQEDWLGLNCSACHTTEIHHNGTAYRIDGGPALADMDGFMTALVTALTATIDSPEKFGRFADKVAKSHPGQSRDALKQQLQQVTAFRAGYNVRNASPHAYGFARLDAFGRILNEVMVRHLNVPEAGQAKPADAPVSYPFLWDTPQHDFVQWNGVAANRIVGSTTLGSLSRNVGEVLGVFGEVNVPAAGESRTLPGYDSSVRVGDLADLEGLVRKLQSPRWIDTDLPPIDETKKTAGEAHYRRLCLTCHDIIDRSAADRTVRAVKTPVEIVRTDPRMALNFSQRKGKTGPLEGRRKLILAGKPFEATAAGDDLLLNVVLGVILNVNNQYTESDLLALRDPGHRATGNPLEVYKARPLNGIWATAPYLHNGSVPSLDQLLLPAAERVKEFSVGSRVFDPAHVGFRTDAPPPAFRFRTTDAAGVPIPGNSNAGHEYGTGTPPPQGGDGKPRLTDAERSELLEFLKSL